MTSTLAPDPHLGKTLIPVPPDPPKSKPASKAVPKVVARVHSAKPQPVVRPSPASSVSGLTPTSTTTGGSGGGTSTAATTSSYFSYNWSGYLSTSGTFTSVSGSWNATNPTGITGTTSADSTWIGIGGVTAGDLIQVGTQNIINSSGQVSTEAFYELLPDFSRTVPGVSVSPGDSMSATIAETSAGHWTITITNHTNGQTGSLNVTYSSTHSSAEWIEEDPSFSNNRLIPFDNFHSASFSGSSAILNGVSRSIAGANGVPIFLVNRAGTILASPSNHGSDGSSFTVTRTGL